LRKRPRVMMPHHTRPHGTRALLASARGFTIPELLVGIAIFGILAASAISNTKATRTQITTAQTQLTAQLRLARIKAITTVSHCSVSFTSTTQFKVYPMTYNGTVWQLATTPSNTVTLPSVVSFPSALVGTRIEFNSRGMVAGTTTVTQINLTDAFGATRTVQAWPSGQVYAL
jgi:prepilin-type N-terminal cleavage/methylation domain-containing protein